MAYSTQADVQNAIGGAERLVQQFDWDRDGAADAAAITDCIAEADALIDSFASKRFTTFNPVPTIIRIMSAKLAILTCARRRGGLDMDQQRDWDQIAGTETGKEGWLYRLATGVVTPGTDPMPAPHTTMVADETDETMPCDRDASRDKLAGYW